MAKTILVVDDQRNLRQMVRSYLEAEGYHVLEAPNGRDALFTARQHKPDLIILDVMMPEVGGIEFMRIYTAEADTPIIMLTARVDETDMVLGLEMGADDYITKPFSPRELAARVRAVLRRAEKPAGESQVLRANGIMLDLTGHMVQVAGKPVELTPSEFNLLALLMASPGRAFSRAELLERMGQGFVLEGVERTVDVHIRNLRTKIEPEPSNPRFIQTVYGVGYRFNAAGESDQA